VKGEGAGGRPCGGPVYGLIGEERKGPEGKKLPHCFPTPSGPSL